MFHSQSNKYSWWETVPTDEDLQDEDTTQTKTQSPPASDEPPRQPRFQSNKQYRLLNVPRRIHVMGTGGVGKLIAHSLRSIPDPPPVTLIFHRVSTLRKWEGSSKEITLITDGIREARSGYDVEVVTPTFRRHGREVYPEGESYGSGTTQASGGATEPPNTSPGLPREENTEGSSEEAVIHSLVLTVKATQVVSALSAVKHRLGSDSTVLFTQNGMGIIEEVNELIFPDPSTRPHYMIGINTHGTINSSLFVAVHSGFGTFSLGILPHAHQTRAPRRNVILPTSTPNPAGSWYNAQNTARYLLRTLARVPVLCAAPFPPSDLQMLQLEKLAINAIVNPLTVLVDARNGCLLYNYHLTRVMRLLLAEISLVIRSLPEIASIPNLKQRFDPGRLETLVVSVADKTRKNISSMLQDVRSGNRTEIEYITGYIVRRGEDLGITPALNYMVMQMVKGKQQMIALENNEEVPFVGGVRLKFPDAETAKMVADETGRAEREEMADRGGKRRR